MINAKLKDESGMVLIIVMLVTLLSSIMAGTYMTRVISESKHAAWQKQKAQSLFLAEAGVERSLYFLNNCFKPDNPWVDDDGSVLSGPLEYSGTLAEGNYEVTLYSQTQVPSLQPTAYLVKSTGIIDRENSEDIRQEVVCVIDKLDSIPIHAALSILDDTDIDDELLKFQSSVWIIDGRDHDEAGALKFSGQGLPGIAVANTGDNLPAQLDRDPTKPKRIDQVKGGDEWGNYYEAAAAILEDPSLPKHLDAYANYFRRIAIDVSGSDLDIPTTLLGTPDQYQVLYANLSEGNKKLAGGTTGYGVLILEGIGEFELAGNATWNGIIVCAGNSRVNFKGGGSTPAHINGALLIANGVVEMNGTADVNYSSDTVKKTELMLLLYQVYSWCGGWGKPIGSGINT